MYKSIYYDLIVCVCMDDNVIVAALLCVAYLYTSFAYVSVCTSYLAVVEVCSTKCLCLCGFLCATAGANS